MKVWDYSVMHSCIQFNFILVEVFFFFLSSKTLELAALFSYMPHLSGALHAIIQRSQERSRLQPFFKSSHNFLMLLYIACHDGDLKKKKKIEPFNHLVCESSQFFCLLTLPSPPLSIRSPMGTIVTTGSLGYLCFWIYIYSYSHVLNPYI